LSKFGPQKPHGTSKLFHYTNPNLKPYLTLSLFLTLSLTLFPKPKPKSLLPGFVGSPHVGNSHVGCYN